MTENLPVPVVAHYKEWFDLDNLRWRQSVFNPANENEWITATYRLQSHMRKGYNRP